MGKLLFEEDATRVHQREHQAAPFHEPAVIMHMYHHHLYIYLRASIITDISI